MEIKIAVTNLGLYNEGELLYKWVTLPLDEQEIEETFQEIKVDGVNYEEHFISDYEAPFEIAESASIEQLNEISEALLDIEEPDFINNFDYGSLLTDIRNIAEVLEVYDVVEEYYLIDEIEDHHYPRNKCGNIDLIRMTYFVANVNGLTEVVRFDGYGNLEEVRQKELKSLYDDVIKEWLVKNK